jgi:hypothetical protein
VLRYLTPLIPAKAGTQWNRALRLLLLGPGVRRDERRETLAHDRRLSEKGERTMRLALVSAILIFLAACAPDAERTAPPPAAGDNVKVVNGLMAAFNAHDAAKMREYWHPDVTWIELSGERASLVTISASQLYTELIAYFEAYPSVSSSLENISVNGNFVTAVERPVWEEAGERKSQASVVVYEIVDGKVKRFWYYPPQ